LPVAEEASRVLLSLPFFTDISPDQQERVVEELEAALR
jgi:dTDP-4-amino-4,6-dideoxygalactose transaminase